MLTITRVLPPVLVLALSLLVPGVARAEQLQRFGDLEVHWVVLASTWLDSDIAASYGITRADNLAILNISPRQVAADGSSSPVLAAVSGSTRNLLGQAKGLPFREIRETGAVYYIAPVRFSPEELLRFEVEVVPGPDQPGAGRAHVMRFEQKVYRDQPQP